MGLTLTSITSPAPRRGYAFTDSPNAPGDRLDAELDRIYQALSDISAVLNHLTDQRASVTLDMLDPAALQQLKAQCTPSLTDHLTLTQSAAGNALVQADRARSEAARATQLLIESTGLRDQTKQLADEAGAVNDATADAFATVLDSATDAENSANDAELAANQSIRAAALSGAWAEYLEGNAPIPAMYFAETAITGEHWSSRFWAHKAAGAFGSLSELYLGVHEDPPTTTSTGDPIPIGAIYYNSISQQPYVWDGTQWVPFYAPTKALLLTLIYSSAAGQTAFPMTTPDLHANSFAINAAAPEPVDVYVNGVRLPPNAPVPGSGDWTLNPATSTVTFIAGLKAGDLVQIDALAPASSIAPSRVQTKALLDFNIDPLTDLPGQIDGVRTSFPLTLAPPPHTAVGVSSAQELFVSLDGVPQQPGVDYSVSGGNIIFGEAPLVGARAWASWYGPGNPEDPGTGFLPLTGGVLTGPLSLDGSTPTLGVHAASKAYVDSHVGSYLPLTGGTVTGATTFNAVSDAAVCVLDTSMGNYPRLPANNVFNKVYAQRGNQSASQQFQFLYPNNNRSQTGVVTSVLTVPASGTTGGVAPQQSAFYGSLVSYEVGSNCGAIAATLTAFAAVPNGLAYGLNTQCVDTITPLDSAACLLQTGVRLQNEYDWFTHNADTSVRGNLQVLWATVAANAGANNIANSIGIFAGSVGTWGIGYQSASGCSVTAMQIGDTAITQVAGLSSQDVQFLYTDAASSTQRYAYLRVNPAATTGGNLLLSSSYSGKLNLQFENLAMLRWKSSTGSELNAMYVSGGNILVLGEGIGRTILKATNGPVMELLNIGTGANGVQVQSVSNGSNPIISAVKTTGGGGTDTDVGLTINSLGLGELRLNQAGGNIVAGSGNAIATTATSGFLLIPTCAGLPTGVVGGAGRAALVVDSTNHKLYFNHGAGWTPVN